MRIKLGLVVLLAAFAVGCAGKMLPSKEPRDVSPLQFAANEWRVPSQTIVLADSSGTTHVHKTFSYIKAIAQSFVKAMPAANTRARYDTYDAMLMGFGGDDRIASPLARFDRSVLASTANELRLLGDIDGLGGETPLDAVFGEVQESLKSKSGVAALVVFSDGLPDSPSAAMEAARQLVASYSEQVCIHTIHFGDNPQGAEFLAALSALTDCGSAKNLAQTWGADNFMKFVHGVFAGNAPAVARMDPCTGRIVLRGVEFAFDKADLTSDSTVVLDVAVQELSKCPSVGIRIEGHTDSVGAEAYNQALGQRRADSVKGYFVDNGLNQQRLTTKSFGETKPTASNATSDGRRVNRRVELHPAK